MEFINPELEAYATQHTSPESPVLKALDRETHAKVLLPRMLSGHLQGRMLSMISNMVKPKCILEIGTYTGYSALCLAEGLAADGKLITIDINEELEEIAERYFEQAGKSHQIQQLIGDAMEIIPTLEEQFDIVFLDADKSNYPAYYELIFDKVVSGGYIIADNIMWSGKVLTDNPKDIDLTAIKQFNQTVLHDARVECIMLPIRDGISIIRKL